MFKRLTVVPLVLLASVVLMRPSAATAATITFLGEGKGATVEIHSPTLGDLTTHAGELNWSSTPSLELAALFYSYCVDATHYLTSTQVVSLEPSDNLSGTGVEQPGGKVAWLLNTYAADIHDGGTDIQAAALQVAIWAALYNPDGSLTNGAFHVNSPGAVTTQAQVFLDNLFTGPTGFRTSDTLFLNASSGQDQMIPTPEPGAFLLMGTGLLIAWRVAQRG
jgi:hypothetical protein